MEMLLKKLTDLDNDMALECILSNETLCNRLKSYLWNHEYDKYLEEILVVFDTSAKYTFGPFAPCAIDVVCYEGALTDLETTIQGLPCSSRVEKLTKRARSLVGDNTFKAAVKEAVQTWFYENVCAEVERYENMAAAIDASDVTMLKNAFGIEDKLAAFVEYGGMEDIYADEDGHYFKVEKIDK